MLGVMYFDDGHVNKKMVWRKRDKTKLCMVCLFRGHFHNNKGAAKCAYLLGKRLSEWG